MFSLFSRQVHLGEDLFSEEQKVKIRKQQEVALSEYMVRINIEFVRVLMRTVKIQ